MWSVKNRPTIHPIKPWAMILKTSAFVGPLPPLYFGTGLTNLADSTTCLGVKIDNSLSWSVHIDSVKKHFTQKFGALKRVSNRVFGIRNFAYFKAGIRDFDGKGGRDSVLYL